MTNGIRWVGRTGLLAAIIALLLAGAPSTSAKNAPPETIASPDTIVSSDGVLPAADLSGVQYGRDGAYVAGAEGNGQLTNGGKDVATDEPNARPATPGGNQPQSVIGADGRTQVTNTTGDPWRKIVSITFSHAGGNYICSGWLISANTVATAGHCVYGSGSWSTNVKVYPGRNGSSTPYGSCGYTRLYATTGWTNGENSNYDYGAIKLNCSVGNQTGWFGFRVAPDSGLTGQQTVVAGYPGDKPSGTLWTHTDSVRGYSTYRISYANDTYGGQSGSAVYNSAAGCTNCAIAVHTNGGTSTNSGTRITQTVFNNLTTWKNAAP